MSAPCFSRSISIHKRPRPPYTSQTPTRVTSRVLPLCLACTSTLIALLAVCVCIVLHCTLATRVAVCQVHAAARQRPSVGSCYACMLSRAPRSTPHTRSLLVYILLSRIASQRASRVGCAPHASSSLLRHSSTYVCLLVGISAACRLARFAITHSPRSLQHMHTPAMTCICIPHEPRGTAFGLDALRFGCHGSRLAIHALLLSRRF